MRDRRSMVEGRLLSGSFNNLEDYKYMVGKLKGISEVENITLELFKNFNES